MPMINGMFTNLPDDYNRGYSPVPQNYGLAMAVENLRGDNQNLPQSFNDKLNSIAEASLKAAQLKRTMNQPPQEDLRSKIQEQLDRRFNRANEGAFSPIPQSLPPPETKTKGTAELQYTPIPDSYKQTPVPDSYKALVEKDKQSEQPTNAKPAGTKPSVSAPNRSKDFIERYKEAARNATMELDPVSFQSNINVALRDPVYGNATATGLATGQSLLNSWIAGNNAKARRDKEALSDMRWIKQMEDADKERQHRLEREKLIDDRYKEQMYMIDANPYSIPAFKEEGLKGDAQASKDIEFLSKPVQASSAIEAARLRGEQQEARNRLAKKQEMVDSKLFSPTSEIESPKSFANLLDRFGSSAWAWGYGGMSPWSKKDAANANLANAMSSLKIEGFSRFTPQDFAASINRDVVNGNTNTAVQKHKILNLMKALRIRGFSSTGVSADGNTIVIASPREHVVVTPQNVDAIAKQYDVSVE